MDYFKRKVFPHKACSMYAYTCIENPPDTAQDKRMARSKARRIMKVELIDEITRS